MRILMFLGLLMIMTSSVHASSQYAGIFSILDEHYAENVSCLPESSDLKPDRNIQRSGHIEAWIDIVGFSRMIREDGIDYVSGNPIDNAIIQYDAKARVSGSITRIDKTVNTYRNGDYLTANLGVDVYWKSIICDDSSCWEVPHHDSATFSDSEQIPKQYHELGELKLIFTQYNNSLYENIGIKIQGDNYTKITFDYKDKHATWTSKILHSENNSKGVVYGNLTELEQWKIEGEGISRFYNEILLDGNLSKMDINEFDIRVYNPFTSKKADPENFTVQRIEFAPQKTINGLLIAVIGIVSTFMVGTLYLFNRTVYRWNIKLF